MVDQVLIDSIFNMYPWATEETASRLAELSRSNNIKSTALATAIAQVTNPTDVKRIQSMIEDAVREVEHTEDAIKNASSQIKSQLKDARSALSGSSGLESIAELTEAGTKALHRVTTGAADMVSGGNAVAGGIARVAGFATGTAVATAGLGTIFASLMSEQEKTVRAMIDFGLIVGDDALYTDLRSRVANFAMGVADYTSILETTKQMMTGVSGDVYSGQVQMLDFLNNTIDDETLSRFGYSPQEYAMQLSQEAAMLYRLNQINDLNSFDQRKVVDSFNTINSLSLFLANNLGMQRSQALALRQESRENLDMQLVMFQQAEYIQEQLGEQARTNITEANDLLYILMSQTVGDQLARETQQVMSNFVRDIQFDTSAVNNIPDDLMQTLQRISPEVAQEYISIIEDAGTGQITAEDMVLRYQRFARAIQQSTAKISPDDIGREATAIRAQVAMIPDSFFNITADTLEAGLAETRDVVDTAGLSVDQLGDISIAYRRAQNALTPGYETMGNLFGLITGSAQRFGEVWSDVFGLEDFRTVEERDSVYRERERLAALAAQYSNIRSGPGSGSGSGSFMANVANARQAVVSHELKIEELEQEYSDLLDAGRVDQAAAKYLEIEEAMQHLEVLENNVRQALAGIPSIPSGSNVSSPDTIHGGLLDFIGRGEGSYTASNRGTLNNQIVGSDMNTIRNGKSLEEMTFAEIFELQQITNPLDPNRLFAVGKYQIIPSTMREIFPHSGLQLTDTFSPENQDILGSLLVVGNEETGYAKRAQLAAYIRGESDDLQAAMLDFAREWASAPDPRTGMSYYGSGNRASHSIDEVAAALMASREQYALTQTINPSRRIGALTARQNSLQTEINSLELGISSTSSETELSELRSQISQLESELATVIDQLNSELASQNASEAQN